MTASLSHRPGSRLRTQMASPETLSPTSCECLDWQLRATRTTAETPLRERAQTSFGPDLQSDWYVFPNSEGYTKPDPTKPKSGWRSGWRSLTRAVNCTACGELQAPSKKCCKEECGEDITKLKSVTSGLRFHDLRHHAITELAESQASDRTIMSIAGHVSQRMLAHYSHVRIDAKRKALDALSEGGKTKGYDTKNDTKRGEVPIPSLQLTEKNRGDDGTRTRGLCRDSLCFRGNCLTIHGADRPYQRPEEPFGSLIAP
jgi:hypothetical protein